MRATQYSVSMSPLTGFTVVLVLLLAAAPPPSLAKRFDCQMFCRTTGFSGMVGGCRCSFTLFTAKRSPRDHNSIPDESLPYLEDQQYSRMPEVIVDDMSRMAAAEIHESQSGEEEGHLEDPRQNFRLVQGLPKSHPVRLLVKSKPVTSGIPSSQHQQPHRSMRLGRSPSQIITKRREFEQDLDNGDTSDYLRLPY